MSEVNNIPLFSPLSDYARGFLEAAIDGEGCITLIKCKRVDRATGRVWLPVVCVSNKSKKWLELVAELASSGRVDKVSRNGPNKFSYIIPRHVARKILPQLGLVIKERQRILILEALVILASHYKGIVTSSPTKFFVDEERLVGIKREVNFLNRKGESIE